MFRQFQATMIVSSSSILSWHNQIILLHFTSKAPNILIISIGASEMIISIGAFENVTENKGFCMTFLYIFHFLSSLTNGITSRVASAGNVKDTDSLTLLYVFYISNFLFKLLSIIKTYSFLIQWSLLILVNFRRLGHKRWLA